MSKLFYTDRELAELLGVSVSLIRKMASGSPSRDSGKVLDIRLIPHFVVGDMRRWNAKATDKLLGITQ